MRRIPFAVALVVCGLALSGCSKPTHESLTKKAISHINDLADVLATVKDESSARAASGRIEKIALAMEELKKQTKELKPISTEEQRQLLQKYQPEMIAATDRMVRELARIRSDRRLAAVMGQKLAELQKQ